MKRFLILPLLLLSLVLVGCAGQTPVQTVGSALMSTHDTLKLGAEAASAQCVAKTIPDAVCKDLLVAYKVFQKSWPIVDDAWLVYAKAPATDSVATTTFNAAYAVWSKDSTALTVLLAQTGVLKTGGQ